MRAPARQLCSSVVMVLSGLALVLSACPNQRRERAIRALEAETWVAPPPEPTPALRDWLAYTYQGPPAAEVSWMTHSFGPRDRLLALIDCRSCGPWTKVGVVPAGFEDPGAPPEGRGFTALEGGATSVIEGSVELLLTNPGEGDWELWVYHVDVNLLNFADNGAGFQAPDVPGRHLMTRAPFHIEGPAPSGWITVEPGRVALDGEVGLASFCTHCAPSAFVGVYPWDGTDSRGGDWRYPRMKVTVGAGETRHRFRAEVVNGGTYQLLLFDREPEAGVDPMLLYRTYLTAEGPEPEPVPPVPAAWDSGTEPAPKELFIRAVVAVTEDMVVVLDESNAAKAGFHSAREAVGDGRSQARVEELSRAAMQHAANADDAAARLLDSAWVVAHEWGRGGRCPEFDAGIARFEVHAQSARDRVLRLRVLLGNPSSLEALQEIEALGTTIPAAIRAMTGVVQDPYTQRERCF